MTIWVIADLHLSFGVANKKMDIFGQEWLEHAEKIAANWNDVVSVDDLVLIPGDISWAMRVDEALADLEWIDRLPGKKILIRGNHDYWWSSLSKVQKALPSSMIALHHTATNWNGMSIAGTRLWDTPELSFSEVIDIKTNGAISPPSGKDKTGDEKIYARELLRLEMALKALDQNANKRIVMTHYPPIGLHLEESSASQLLEKYHVDICVFGHLHSVKPGRAPFGTKHGVSYYLTSCDYLNFKLLKII